MFWVEDALVGSYVVFLGDGETVFELLQNAATKQNTDHEDVSVQGAHVHLALVYNSRAQTFLGICPSHWYMSSRYSPTMVRGPRGTPGVFIGLLARKYILQSFHDILIVVLVVGRCGRADHHATHCRDLHHSTIR